MTLDKEDLLALRAWIAATITDVADGLVGVDRQQGNEAAWVIQQALRRTAKRIFNGELLEDPPT